MYNFGIYKPKMEEKNIWLNAFNINCAVNYHRWSINVVLKHAMTILKLRQGDCFHAFETLADD